MYKAHQDAALLPLEFNSTDYSFGEEKLPAVSASASRDKAGTVHVTLCNMDPRNANSLSAEIRGFKPTSISGQILTAGAMNAHNNFEKPDAVTPARFTGATLGASGFKVQLPAKSVVALELR
jgi:alpha-N-arabinofuranosidase